MISFELSRKNPALDPVVSPELSAYTSESKTKRAFIIGMELLPLISMISPKIGHHATGLAFSLRAFSAAKGHRVSQTVYLVAAAVGSVARPVLTMQFCHTHAALNQLFNCKTALHQDQFVDAFKHLGMAAYHISYVAILATTNAQIIAVSLAAQTAFSFYRAYQFRKQGMNIEAGINVVIGGAYSYGTYQRRADLYAAAETVATKVNETISWVRQKAVDIPKSSLLSLLETVHIDDFTAIDELPEPESLEELFHYLQKVAQLTKDGDYYLTQEDYDTQLVDANETKQEMAKELPAQQYQIICAIVDQILANLKDHIK